jgi:hypothetical protein
MVLVRMESVRREGWEGSLAGRVCGERARVLVAAKFVSVINTKSGCASAAGPPVLPRQILEREGSARVLRRRRARGQHPF